MAMLQDSVCLLCNEVMRDPVFVASEQTFERACIQKWLDEGYASGPINQQSRPKLSLLPQHMMPLLSPSPSCPLSSPHRGSVEKREDVEIVIESKVVIELQLQSTPTSSFPIPSQSFCSVSMAKDTERDVAKASNVLIKSLQGNGRASFHSGSALSQSSCLDAEIESCKISIKPLQQDTGCSVHLGSSSLPLVEDTIHGIANDSKISIRTVQKDGRTSLHSESCACLSSSSLLTLSDVKHGLIENGNSCISSLGCAETFERGDSTQSQIKQEGIETMIMEGGSKEDKVCLMTENLSYCPSHCNSSRDCVVATVVAFIQTEEVKLQKLAVSELRQLAKSDEQNRGCIVKAGALPHLIALLHHSTDEAVQRDTTTTILNLSLNPDIRPIIVEQGAILPLIRIVESGLTSEASENAALALSNLAAIQKFKARIGSAGAIPPLVRLLGSGSERGKKDAATALYMLSSNDENKRRIVRAGAVKLIVDFLCVKLICLMDKSLAILTNLVTIEEGRLALILQGGTSLLLQVIQGTGSLIGKEMAISILLLVCNCNGNYRSIVLEEDPIPSLQALSECGCRRIKAKAAELFCILQEHAGMPSMKAIALKG